MATDRYRRGLYRMKENGHRAVARTLGPPGTGASERSFPQLPAPGARSMGGPATTDAEDKLQADASGRVFRMPSYGQPALVKLLNNALATYNLAATARMLNLAAQLGIPAQTFVEVIGASTGRSWMSDNFVDVQYDLLLEDAALLRGEIGSLPAVDPDDDVE